MLLAASLTLALCSAITLVTSSQHPLSYATFSLVLWVIAGGLGLSQGLFNATFYAVITAGYSASIRASGSGFALMVNRAGGVVSIIVSGIVMTATQESAPAFALTLGAVILVAIGAVLIIDRHIPPMPTKRIA